MKKILILLIVIAGKHFLYAQVSDNITADIPEMRNNRFNWGIKGGINYYNFYGTDRDYIFAGSDTKFKPGFHAGIFINTKLSDHTELTHELIFNQRRAGVTYQDDNNNSYNSTISSSYIDIIPAHISYRLSAFKFYAGPYLSILISAATQRRDKEGNMFRDKSIFGDAANDESKSYYLQKLDFGMNFGIDYQLRDRWIIGLRYSPGFTDLFQNANSSANGNVRTDKIRIYNRGVMLSFGYELTRSPAY